MTPSSDSYRLPSGEKPPPPRRPRNLGWLGPTVAWAALACAVGFWGAYELNLERARPQPIPQRDTTAVVQVPPETTAVAAPDTTPRTRALPPDTTQSARRIDPDTISTEAENNRPPVPPPPPPDTVEPPPPENHDDILGVWLGEARPADATYVRRVRLELTRANGTDGGWLYIESEKTKVSAFRWPVTCTQLSSAHVACHTDKVSLAGNFVDSAGVVRLKGIIKSHQPNALDLHFVLTREAPSR